MQTLFQTLEKSSVLNVEIGGSEEQAKFNFPVTTVTACRAKFKKSHLTQFLSELSRSCAQIETPDVQFLETLISFTNSKYSERYGQGYGHVKLEYPTFLRSKGKAIAVTLSDDKVSNHESGSDEDGNFITFIATAIVDEGVVIVGCSGCSRRTCVASW